MSIDAQKIDNISFLKNGKIYSPDIPYYPAGNQYFNSHDFIEGSVFINEIKYDSVLINLDIYHQSILIKYKTLNNSDIIVQLSEAWVDSFYFYEKHFIIIDSLSKKLIFQLIGNSRKQIYIHYYKNLLTKSSTTGLVFYFTSAKRKLYLKSDNELLSFKNRRTLLKLFDKNKRSKIRKFIKSNKIKIKKANDDDFYKLIKYLEEVE